MIPIIEDYLKDILEDRLEHLRKNPEEIDIILDMSSRRRSSLKQQMVQKPVNVVNGYPRTPALLPCICILLSKETEVQDGLGDYGEDSYHTSVSSMEEVEVLSYPDSKLPYASVIVKNKPLESIQSITDNVTGRVLDADEYWVSNYQLGIIGLPDIHPEPGDTMTINYTSSKTGSEDLSVLYDSNFRVEVWTQNGDLTVELYHLVKWMLLDARDELVYNKGLVRQKLSGSDFEPVTSYFPEFVYRRALQFWCQFSASIVTSKIDYIQDVETTMYVGPEVRLRGDIDVQGNKYEEGNKDKIH